MHLQWKDLTLFLLGFLIALIFFLCVGIYIKEVYYKLGQVDAITGKVVYELVENPDKTKEWEKKGN